MSDTDINLTCEWYLLCRHAAAGLAAHPVLGDLPICQRCADRHGLAFTALSGGGRA